MGNLLQDIRYGIRMLLKRPGFTVVAVLTLALGIGANTAIFSVVNAVLLRPLPFKEADRLVLLSQKTQEIKQRGFSVPDLFDFKEQNRSFESFAGFYSEPINFGSSQGAERLPASYVSADFFATLGVRPLMGRTFLPAEDHPGTDRVVIISQRLWQERFRGSADTVGKAVSLDGKPFTVVGVIPSGFRLYGETDLWLPFGLWPYSGERSDHWALYAVARLKRGVTFQAAQAEMEAIANGLSQQYPKTNSDAGAQLFPLYEDMVGDIRPALLILLAAVGLVLLIACVNIANLLLARAASRQKEIAIRAALGANRGRIVRQLLTENLMLAVIGGGLGVLLAFWGMDLVLALGGADIPRIHEVAIDRRVLVFSLVVSLFAGLIFGLVPALQAAETDLTNALKESGQMMSGSGRGRLRNALVICEIALALVLLIGAGLLIKSLVLLRGVNPGYNSDHVLTVEISLPRTKYQDEFDKARFSQQALERVRTLPGVQQAAASYPLPVYGRAWGMFYRVEGQPEPEPGKFPLSQVASVSPDFFSTLQIPLMQGRSFTNSDTQESPGVVIIDETLARLYWPNENPTGKRLTIQPEDRPREIVGVAGSVRNYGLGRSPKPQIYIPYNQRIQSTNLVPFEYLTLRTATDPASMTQAVKKEIQEVDRDIAISEIKPMNELLDEAIADRRFSALLMEIFSILALILAAVGIYGVMAYSVSQRTHEIGIRMALGAQSSDILKLVVGQGMILTLIGLIIGLTGAFVLTRLMSSLLYGVSATDPFTFIAISLLLAGVALVASYIPARRAMKVDPMVALRYE
jgi:putative ABC transport system permease protein